MMDYPIIIVGAGAAGIGFGVMLKRFGLDDFIILERGRLGQSFLNWPKTTRFITPSFTTNGFGFPDLNAVVPNSSPAFTFEKEHLSGPEYAHYLALVAKNYDLPIKEGTPVLAVEQVGETYLVVTPAASYRAKYVIFATGEYQNPYKPPVPGVELAMHYGEIDSFHIQSGQAHTVIGGNESGCDALIHLSLRGNPTTLYTRSYGRRETAADPSISLSPMTKERLAQLKQTPGLSADIVTDKGLAGIQVTEAGFLIDFADGSQVESPTPPVLATGFRSCLHQIEGDLFDYDADGLPLVNAQDESTRSPNLFLIGPSLRQEEVIFCYIYKFRQRFLPILEEIARREAWSLDPDAWAFYEANQMYLPQTNCCDVVCDC